MGTEKLSLMGDTMTTELIKTKQNEILKVLKDKAKLYKKAVWLNDSTLAEKVGLFPQEVRALLKRNDFPERIFIQRQENLQTMRYRYSGAQ